MLHESWLHDFSATIPRHNKDVYVYSFFPHTSRLWNSLPIEYFPLNYDLSGFKYIINRHLLSVGSFLSRFTVFFNLFEFFSCNSMYIHTSKSQLYCMWLLWTSKNHIFSCRYISELYSFVSVCENKPDI